MAKNQKRTNDWLSRTGLQLPVGEKQRGSIRKITYSGGKVKIQNPIHMTQMQEKLYKAGVIDEYGEVKKSKDDTIDADYLSAVERGDMETEQRMVDEVQFLYCYRPFFMLKYNKRRDAYGETIIGEKGKEG